MNFAEWAIGFNHQLSTITKSRSDTARITTPAGPVTLPPGFEMMNPFASGAALDISRDFYHRYYSDTRQRRIILGINPGRHGAGLTGVPFTDSKQLATLGIDSHGITSYEPSALFIYRMIERYGGAEKFYRHYYVNSPLPLGLLRKNDRGNLVNANYYDTAPLQQSVEPLIDYSMAQYRSAAIDLSTAYCLGQGKNYRYLERWNQHTGMFKTITPLPHPRYIVQYKLRKIEEYITDYLEKLEPPSSNTS